MNEYAGIVEIKELRGGEFVNQYLDAGYVLLRIEGVAGSARHPTTPPGNMAGSYFVWRFLRYIVGRTAEVTHFELPPRSPREAAEA